MNNYQANLTLLQQRDPALAARVAGSTQDAQVNLQDTQAGPPTVIVHTQNQSIALHHPSDPVGQSQTYLDTNANWKQARNIAILGGGLGYVPLLIHQTQSKLQNLFVFEPSLSVFRAAMQAIDLSPLLCDPRVRYVVGSEPGAVYAALMQSVIDLIANPLTAQEVPSVTAPFPGWVQSVKQQLIEVMQFGQSGLFTKFKDGPLTLSNLFQNLEAVGSSPGLNTLRGKLQNTPAVIVAAGPSLKKNVDGLKELNGRFLVIATDTAFEFLLQKGVVPHIVVTVDPTELNIKHFPQEQYGEQTILLFDPEARPEAVQKFPNRLSFTTDKHPFFDWLDTQLNEKGKIPKGNMVSQAGLYAAHYLGCDPLILIGQDLALDPETGFTHTPEAAYCRKAEFLPDDKNHVNISVPSGEQAATRENLFWVEGIDGNPVPTVQNFLVYIRMLEKDIRTFHWNLIDATEGGAKIQGSQILSLTQAIEQNGNKGVLVPELLRSLFTAPNAQSESSPAVLKQSLRDILESRTKIAEDGLKEMSQSAVLTQAVLAQMIQMYREKIFGDPVAEYLIEYGAPRELFDFMKLGPAAQTSDEERQQTQNRLRILLETVPKASQRLLEFL